MSTKKRGYIREDSMSFRPSPEVMRKLEEMWEAWGESRTEVLLYCIETTYLLWKNDWILAPQKEVKPEYKPLRVKED